MSAISTITKHLPGWPQGSPGQIQDAAAIWRTAAGQLAAVTDEMQRQIDSLGATWQGPGKTSFMGEWTRLAAAAREAGARLEDLATSLSNFADQLLNAQRRYKEVEGAAAVTLVIGVATSFLTFGASDAAAGEAAAGEVSAAVGEAVEATSMAALALQAAEDIAIQIVTRFAVFSAVDLVAQGAISALVFPDHNPFSHLDLRAAPAAGLDQAAPELDLESPAAKMVAQGLTEGGFNAASQLAGTGHIDPIQVAGSSLHGVASAGLQGQGDQSGPTPTDSTTFE
jgi:WXG100 family type VII secretion target